MRAPLLWLATAFLAGVAVATGFEAPGVEAAAMGIVAVGAAGLVIGRSRVGLWGRGQIVVAIALPLLFGLGLIHADDGLPTRGTVAQVATGRTVTLTGVVVDDPTRFGDAQQFRLRAETATVGAETANVDGTVLLTAPVAPGLRYGDRVRGAVALRPPPPDRPDALDDLLRERGLSGTGRLRDPIVLARDQGSALRGALSDTRREMDAALAHTLDEPLAGLAQGIVTGRRDALPTALRDDLNATGLSHLVVISGSNVTLLAGLVVGMTAWAVGRRRAVLIALGTVAAYTLFVGADAPVVRAAVMAAVFLTAGRLGRRSSPLPAVALAGALMVAVSPGVIGDLSFQLSFTATAALAALGRPLRARSFRALGLGGAVSGPLDRTARALTEIAIVTLIATAATLPLIALTFERVSIVALPANLLVAPLFPLIFLGSLGTAIAGSVDPALGDVAGWTLAWLPLRWFVAVAEGMADLPIASARVERFGLVHALLLYAVLVLFAIRLHAPIRSPHPDRPRDRLSRRLGRWSRPAAWGTTGLLAVLNVVVWSGVAAGPEATLRVDFLDVGQGDATLVQAPSGATLLIDGGPAGAPLLAGLSAALPPGTRRLDVVVATHPQADHIGGLFALFDRYRVGRLVVGPAQTATTLGALLVAEAEARGVPVTVAARGSTLDLGDHTVTVLSPAPAEQSAGGDAAAGSTAIGSTAIGSTAINSTAVNDASLILRIAGPDGAVLLSGDMEATAELALASGPTVLEAAVLKVAHHGSRTSSTDLFLRRVRPAVAVISVGASNGFGHPHQEVVERLAEGTLLRTDTHGTITIRLDAGGVRYATQRDSP